jgi:ribosomal protein S18 acetylase RimI-like enzyme
MRIEEASEKDFPAITELIVREFPYVERSTERMREKTHTGAATIFKAVEGEQIVGFIELEFVGKNVARINGLSVKEPARGRGVGKKLLQFAIEFLRKKGTNRVFLLVKQANKKAKAIYESTGFRFIGLYHRRIDNAVVEEMELDLSTAHPTYVS